MIKYLITIYFLFASALTYGELAGGRPNSISQGENAFAGVVNPANAVWLKDRIDVGLFYLHQQSSLTNKNNNPLYPPGKTDLTYHAKNLLTGDVGIHKQFQIPIKGEPFNASFSLATYTMPTQIKVHTKEPIPASGKTPMTVTSKTEVLSAVFSFQLNTAHSVGVSIDCLYFSKKRDGFQNSDNPLRSVSPGHVTNNGTDHSCGISVRLGWRWNISEKLSFGLAWSQKSYCGQYRRYRGFDPHHAKNYIPQTLGAGLTYRFTSKMAGRAEVLWSNLGNTPGANNNILPDGKLNLNKRGSNRSPGPGLQDATFVNLGLGYKINDLLSIGTGYSHRIKLGNYKNILSHTYSLQTIYNTLSLGVNFRYEKHDLFLSGAYGFKNKRSGELPNTLGGGILAAERQTLSCSLSWGYRY